MAHRYVRPAIVLPHTHQFFCGISYPNEARLEYRFNNNEPWKVRRGSKVIADNQGARSLWMTFTIGDRPVEVRLIERDVIRHQISYLPSAAPEHSSQRKQYRDWLIRHMEIRRLMDAGLDTEPCIGLTHIARGHSFRSFQLAHYTLAQSGQNIAEVIKIFTFLLDQPAEVTRATFAARTHLLPRLDRDMEMALKGCLYTVSLQLPEGPAAVGLQRQPPPKAAARLEFGLAQLAKVPAHKPRRAGKKRH